MFRKTGYAIKNQSGQYLLIVKSRFGLEIAHENSPEQTLIWEGLEHAQDLLFHAEQHQGEKCILIEFELVEQKTVTDRG